MDGARARAELVTLQTYPDARGVLSVLGECPFPAVRVFFVRDVPDASIVRGGHAHRLCHQLLISVTGSVRVHVVEHDREYDVDLATPDQALHIPPMVWAHEAEYSSDAVLMVLASHAYDPAEYVNELDEFHRLIASG